jgi:Family of unknown function (DUF6496)
MLEMSQGGRGFGSGMTQRPAPMGGGGMKPIAVGGPARSPFAPSFPRSFKKGGKVLKSGVGKLHKGERVISAHTKAVLGGKKKSTPKGKKAKGKIAKTMHEWGQGNLHSGSKKGPVVKNQKQAVAIALSQARKANGG